MRAPLRRRTLLLAAAGLWATRLAAQGDVARWRGLALGGSAELRINTHPSARSAALLEQARRELLRLEAIFSLNREDSAVSRLNRDGYIADPPQELLVLLSIAARIHHLTGGVFDPTIQVLWALYAESRGSPAPAALDSARRLVGWRHLRFDARGVHLLKRGAQLSLNGIAQGFISDRIARYWQEQGVTSALVDCGEIRVIGHDAGGVPWRVGLAAAGNAPPEHHLALVDSAVATSATFGTTIAGKVAHVLDPRTAMPATPRWRFASALHSSAAVADGLATAALLMSRAEVSALVARLDGLTMYLQPFDGGLLRLPDKR